MAKAVCLRCWAYCLQRLQIPLLQKFYFTEEQAPRWLIRLVAHW